MRTGHTAKLINLPDDLWEMIAADAEASKRSVNGQVEVLLRNHYETAFRSTLRARVDVLEREIARLTEIITGL